VGGNMGLNKLSGRVILLPEARMDYSMGQIRRFVKLWNEGQPVTKIAESFGIAMYEVGLLVMHCELEGWIEQRPGGLRGTIKHKWKQKVNQK
jgi:hypothetical protein